MKVNATLRRTHTHRDLGRIRIMHRHIIGRIASVRVGEGKCSWGIKEGSKQGRGGIQGRHRLRPVSGGMCGDAFIRVLIVRIICAPVELA